MNTPSLTKHLFTVPNLLAKVKTWVSSSRDGISKILIPRLILVLGLISSILFTLALNRAIDERDRMYFGRQSGDMADAIRAQLIADVSLISGAAAFVIVRDDLSKEDFSKFVTRLNIKDTHSEILGLGFAERVVSNKNNPQSSVESSDTINKDTTQSYIIGGDSFIVKYFESSAPSIKTVSGYDLLSDLNQRSAIEHARDSGSVTLGGRATPSNGEDIESSSDFFVYIPVYRGHSDPTTLQERRERIRGFIYVPFRASQLINEVFGRNLNPAINLELFDLAAEGTPRLSAFGSNPIREPGALSRDETIEFGGGKWLLRFYSTSIFNRSTSKRIVIFLFLIQSALLFTVWRLTVMQFKIRESLESINLQREHLLASERAARSDAQRSARSRDEFLATVSHELRSPLNAVLGWAQLLKRSKPSSDRVERGLDTIERNVRIQAQLIDDLLDMSRITSGKLRMDMKPVDLDDIVDAALESVKPALSGKGIQFEKNIARNLGLLRADPQRLQQIVWNLLSNATKFTPSGGRVTLTAKLNDSLVEISVSDTGCGISETFLPYLFNRFRQADSSTTRKHGGLGLGLAITKNLVELHGGTISAESAGEGKGAKITFTIPCLSKVQPEVHAQGEKRSEGFELHNMSILIVDDEGDAREILGATLEGASAVVTSADSADKASKLLEEREFDLLISDLGMPNRDGYELIKTIRARGLTPQKLPAIALSAMARLEDQALAIESGFNVHLTKPFDATNLITVIHQLTSETSAT